MSKPITIKGIVANVKPVKKDNSYTLSFLTKSWESVTLSMQVSEEERDWVVQNLKEKKKQCIQVQGTLEESNGSYKIMVTDLHQVKITAP